MDCQRCGADVSPSYIAKRVERGLAPVCKSCSAKRRLRIRTSYGICWPHQGEFDLNDNPLTEAGVLLYSNVRLCGNRDCVNPEHLAND